MQIKNAFARKDFMKEISLNANVKNYFLYQNNLTKKKYFLNFI